jgi:ribonuclease P protein component|tara:strand:+ start:15941 stop:16345 length:405 start_codon:yes stop_codon:yes gene_type:complete
VGAAAECEPGAGAFGKCRRLLNAAQYRAVFDGASIKASHRHLLMLARPADGRHSRLGLVIAKKNVRKAVQRNRIKRIVRESFRQLPDTGVPLDIVFLARRGLDDMDNASLFATLGEQWQKLSRHKATHTGARDR